MELKLKPFPKNQYPTGAVLIKGSSPHVWLHEIQAMGISLSGSEAYAIPGDKANVLYGCLLVVPSKPNLERLGKNSCLQLMGNKLFIPEYATVEPAIGAGEWDTLMPGYQHVMLPETGLYCLEEPINWLELLETGQEVLVRNTVPSKAVAIPENIRSLRVELDEATLLQQLEKPQTEEEIIEKLPFNMKKLLNGNQREIEKYLAYIEKNPEMALKYALPLDIIGSSRYDSNGSFSFSSSFFDNFFGGWGKSGSLSLPAILTSKAVILLAAVALLIKISITIFHDTNFIPVGTGVKSTSKSQMQNVINGETKIILIVFIAVITGMILKLAFTSRLILSAQKDYRQGVFLTGLLLVAVGVLIFPIYNSGELSNALSFGLLILLGIILYRVFNRDKTLIRDNEDK